VVAGPSARPAGSITAHSHSKVNGWCQRGGSCLASSMLALGLYPVAALAASA
jgi:hypothetical protein